MTTDMCGMGDQSAAALVAEMHGVMEDAKEGADGMNRFTEYMTAHRANPDVQCALCVFLARSSETVTSS